jgi:hypothetical protein
LEEELRKLAAVLFVSVCMMAGSSAFAQGIDFAFGISTTTSPKAAANATSACLTTGTCNFQSLSGGAYPSISGDFLIHKNFGVQGEVAWRGSRGDYSGFGIPYRPLLWDFNALYAPKVGRVGGELMAGIGALSARFYQNQIVSCSQVSGCTNYVSSNHLSLHVGGGVRFYILKSVFLRPEAHYYFARNANVDFTSNSIFRVGASIGLSFGR